jgi:DNA-binding transcriptional LysR family regulator
MDLDIRKLRYFAAVAEHQHFGRAAEQLYIAQPVLSRQIRALENELGCVLLNRTTRSVQLTTAGLQLQKEARTVLGSVDAALRRVHEADRGVERLVIGFMPGLRVSEVVRAYTANDPGVDIELKQLHWWEQDAPLRDGRIDVGFLRRPFDEAGLAVTPIAREARVACLPSRHPLASRTSLMLADLEPESVLDAQARRTASVEEKFELVAAGHGIAVVPESLAQSYSRPDLVAVVVTDAAPVETCLAVVADQAEPRVLNFLMIAAETLEREYER